MCSQSEVNMFVLIKCFRAPSPWIRQDVVELNFFKALTGMEFVYFFALLFDKIYTSNRKKYGYNIRKTTYI